MTAISARLDGNQRIMDLMGLPHWPELWLPLAWLAATVGACAYGFTHLRTLDSSLAHDPEAVWGDPRALDPRARWRRAAAGILVTSLWLGAMGAGVHLARKAGVKLLPLGEAILFAATVSLAQTCHGLNRRKVMSRSGLLPPLYAFGLAIWTLSPGTSGSIPGAPAAAAYLLGALVFGVGARCLIRGHSLTRSKLGPVIFLSIMLLLLSFTAVRVLSRTGDDPIAAPLEQWLKSPDVGPRWTEWEVLADAVEELRRDHRPVPDLTAPERAVQAILRRGIRLDGPTQDAIVRLGLASVADFDPREQVFHSMPFWSVPPPLDELPLHIEALRERLVLRGLEPEDRDAVAALCRDFLRDPAQLPLTDTWTVVRMLDLIERPDVAASARPQIAARLEAARLETKDGSGFRDSPHVPGSPFLDRVDEHATWAATALMETTGARPRIDLVALRKSLMCEPAPLLWFADEPDSRQLCRRLGLAHLDRAGLVIPSWPWLQIAGWLQLAATLLVSALLLWVLVRAPAIPLPRKPRRLPPRKPVIPRPDTSAGGA